MSLSVRRQDDLCFLMERTLYNKNLHIHGYFVARVPHFNGTGSVYTFVSVNRRNNEARAHVAMSILRIQRYIRNRCR